MKLKRLIIIIIFCLTLFIPLSPTIVAANNNPPDPPVIEGPTSGKINEIYIYNFTVTDPDEDDKLLSLEIDWGDGTQTETCGCGILWENGETLQIEHRWKKAGSYEVSARAADVYNYWSEWADPFSVSMPKNKNMIVFPHQFYNRILEIFPILKQLINIILR